MAIHHLSLLSLCGAPIELLVIDGRLLFVFLQLGIGGSFNGELPFLAVLAVAAISDAVPLMDRIVVVVSFAFAEEMQGRTKT